MAPPQVLVKDDFAHLAAITPAMMEALPVAIYTTDSAGCITTFNQTAAAFWGRTPRLGEERWCGAFRLFWPDGQPMPHHECPMAMTLKTGQPVRDVEAIIERPDGSRATFISYPTALKNEAGMVTGGINMLVDITERKQADHAREQWAAIVESSDDPIISKSLSGIILSWNKGAERVFGYSAEEAIGRSVTMLIPDDRQNEEPDIIARIRRGERVDHYETVRRRKDGSLIDISLSVSPVKNSLGQVVGASKIARDITDRTRAERARELLLHEIKHRVKNTLGTVQAIASQTFRDSSRLAREAFNARLRALSEAHDLLTRQDWDKVSLQDIVLRSLESFQEKRHARIAVEGVAATLSSNQALLLAMAVHELATNAVKYGALSNDNGTVSASWRIEHGNELTFRWLERGGPPVQPPSRRGFGTTLIERALQQEQGASRILFEPDGIDCVLWMKI